MRFPHFLFLMTVLSSCMSRIEVDTIIHNGNIYTVDESFSVQEAMAIRNDSIIEVGPEHQILNKYSSKSQIDLQGMFVYPGFIDAHCHFIGYAKNLNKLDLVGCESQEDMFKKVNEFSQNITGEWLQGRGWDQNDWEDKTYPSKAWLDENLSDKYVVLKRVDGHAALVNQKALDLAGITASTKIDGGLVEVIDGKCTGILIDNAVDLVSSLIPEPSEEELKSLVLKAQSNCFEKGITTVSDAGLDLDEVRFIEKWQEEGSLEMKCYVMLNPTEENFQVFGENGPFQNRNLSVTAFKFYADGALGSRGASLLEDYSDDEGNKGLILTSNDSLRFWAQRIYDAGFQMNTHAIGDSANRLMCGIYADVLEGTNDRRWRIEHAQVVNKEDLSLFREYNIIPSVQPTHATSDMPWAIDRLGEGRIDEAYAYQSLKNQNGLIAFGTDFPVESIDPLNTIISAIRRTDSKGHPEGGYRMNESLSFEDCLKAMTIWAAIANFEENKKGSLESGKSADFIIFNRDLKSLMYSNIDKYSVQSVYLDGKLVHSID